MSAQFTGAGDDCLDIGRVPSIMLHRTMRKTSFA
ncbi:MAG: hypothetical protein QOD93_2019 [Acetobacteraceae bacterium]|jgi:hypothetical protein|nr:hypothetical protein [Acetobacteraceae bacterium]